MKKILIIFPSWEERSILGFQKNLSRNPDINTVYLFSFAISAHHVRTNNVVEQMKVICREKNIAVEIVIIPNGEVEKWQKLDAFAKGIADDADVCIDITTMPRSIIWTLFFFFKPKYKQATVVYHQPKTYGDWLTKDPYIPQLLFKHSGIIEFGKPTTLMVLAGFDEDRVIQLINYFEPQNVVIGRCNQRKDFDYCSADIFDVPQYDNSWGYEIIGSKIEKILSKSNLIVASLGPKTGAISVYQCFMRHPEIALTYVPCNEFNIDYSKGIGDTFVKTVTFASSDTITGH